jgi:hypothetical protein
VVDTNPASAPVVDRLSAAAVVGAETASGPSNHVLRHLDASPATAAR